VGGVSAHGSQALAGHIRKSVLDAVHAVAEFPREALQIQQSLLDDITAAPVGCLTQAVAELRALAVYLWSNESARWGFGHTGVESDVMEDELWALADNPYRSAAQQHSTAGSTVEHQAAAFALGLVMALAWPARTAARCARSSTATPSEDLLLILGHTGQAA
jgi:hypothetical protein